MTKPISEQLRLAVERSPLSRYELAKRTGVEQASLSRFVHGKCGLSQDAIDALGKLLKLRLVGIKTRARWKR